MYELPYGNTQQLNLDWFIKRWQEFYSQWQETEAGIDHALDAEIQRVEDAMTDLYAARDAAAASATAAAASASSASNSATTATNAATAAAASATLANNKATAAGLSEAAAANSANSASNSAGAASTSAAQASASEASATASAQSATASATAAAASETNAAASAEDAEESAQRAEDAAASASAGGVVKSVENVPIASVDDALDEDVVELVVGIDPVQAGTGDPAPDNVRPITGWTGANVKRTGKNLFDETQYQNLVTSFDFSEDSYHTKIIQLAPNTTYTVSQRAGTTDSSIIALINSNRKVNSNDYLDLRLAYHRKTYTTDDSGRLYIGIVGGSDVGYNARLALCKVQIEVGSSASEYETFTGITYPLTFPAEAGTVYGGTLSNQGSSGCKLIVDRAIIDLGTLNYDTYTTSGINYFFTSALASVAKHPISASQVANIICTTYPIGIASDITIKDKYIWLYTNGNLCIKDTSYEDTATFKTAMNGVMLVYELITPIEYTFTTAEVIQLLAGYNNLWADTGNVNLLRYYADSKAYIDAQDALVKALIAKELDDMIADTALTANDFRIVNNTLYRITAPIASGATLTPNTNCTATTVSEILKTLLT